ncbi:MAG: extracellular solute-binding protein [Chloroflexi bacterium]|nr:extracellular solute-binding protein [Chloroflexota bacterium]
MFRKPFRLMLPALLLWATVLYACNPPGPATPPPAATAAPAAPAAPAWQAEWDRTLEAARHEGSLIIYSTWPGEVRAPITAAFKAKYGIGIEWMLGSAGEQSQRLFSQRRAGIYQADVYLAGGGTPINSFLPAGILDRLDPLLLLPEVTSTEPWFQNRIPFVDQDHFLIALRMHIQIPIRINTEMVRSDEIKSYRDLLNPKWTGKIVMGDPTTAGSANSWVTTVSELIMGLDYIKELAKQKPVISRNERLNVEQVARGKYPLLIGVRPDEVIVFTSQGAPLAGIMPVEGAWMDSGAGTMVIINRPANPAARKVFVNWILTREGLTLFSKASGVQTSREDVPTDHIDPLSVRDPKSKYVYSDSMENNLARPRYQELAKEIFAASLK